MLKSYSKEQSAFKPNVKISNAKPKKPIAKKSAKKIQQEKISADEFQLKYGNNPKKAKKLIFGSAAINKMSTSKVKKDLDVLYSMVVRMEACSTMGVTNCVTCGKVAHWTKLQNGHFIKRSIAPALIFNRMNSHSQCVRCNVLLEGNRLSYVRYMNEKYGEVEVKNLEGLANIKGNITNADYTLMAKEYAKRVIAECERLDYQPTQAQLTIINRWS